MHTTDFLTQHVLNMRGSALPMVCTGTPPRSRCPRQLCLVTLPEVPRGMTTKTSFASLYPKSTMLFSLLQVRHEMQRQPGSPGFHLDFSKK